MRPTPAEVIEGVRRVLRDVVEPEVGSEYARSRLREVRAVLAQIDWDDAALRVREERNRIRDLLSEAQVWIAADDERARALANLDGRLEASPTPQQEPLAEANASRAAEAALLIEVADALAQWIAEHPDADDAQQLRRRLAAGLTA